MGFFNLIEENLIFPAILTFISSLFILYATLVITERFKNKLHKKRREMYIKFLMRYNNIIDKCILEFEKPNDVWQIRSIGLGVIFAGFLTIIIFKFCFNVLEMDVWRSMAYSSLVNVVPYILTIILIRNIITDERKLLDEHNRIKCWFKGLKWFINGTSFIIIFFIYMSVSLINYSIIPVSTSEIGEIRNIYTISLTIIVVTVIILKWNYDEFLDKIKSKLSTQYLNEFPFVHITTEDREVTGKIQDVFDNDFVILDDNGLKTAVEWKTITILGLKE
ncbi:MAG: hypothetical protein KAT05_07610 [Spirochaetes bacterium]|nr:hypothetical protein [Spirochaetota bacterium]